MPNDDGPTTPSARRPEESTTPLTESLNSTLSRVSGRSLQGKTYANEDELGQIRPNRAAKPSTRTSLPLTTTDNFSQCRDRATATVSKPGMLLVGSVGKNAQENTNVMGHELGLLRPKPRPKQDTELVLLGTPTNGLSETTCE